MFPHFLEFGKTLSLRVDVLRLRRDDSQQIGDVPLCIGAVSILGLSLVVLMHL